MSARAPTDGRIRVLHVHTLPVISGSGINTFISMQGAPRERYAVELASAAGGGGAGLHELVRRYGMTSHEVRHMAWDIDLREDALVVGELVRLMRRGAYDVVHTHNSKAGFVGRLAAYLAGVPVIIHTCHGYAFHDAETPLRRATFRALERLATAWCDRIIVISQPMMDWALAHHIAPPSKLVKIYSGIDTTAFQAPVDVTRVRAALGLRPEHFVVAEVAKLWEGKGHEVLLAAAAQLVPRLPELRVLVVGEGALRPRLEAETARLGLGAHVIFTGFRDDVPALLQAVDVCALPSFYEGMARAVLEGQAAGRAVVATRVGGIVDLVRDGETGLLVPAGDVASLAGALERLARDEGLRARLGDGARRAIGEQFEARTMVGQILALYEELLAAKGRGERGV
jgi:glycosyltransferase involved in cell wall biosynthesis